MLHPTLSSRLHPAPVRSNRVHSQRLCSPSRPRKAPLQAMASWRDRLEAIGLDADQKGKALHLILKMAEADRELLVDTEVETAKSAVLARLAEAPGKQYADIKTYKLQPSRNNIQGRFKLVRHYNKVSIKQLEREVTAAAQGAHMLVPLAEVPETDTEFRKMAWPVIEDLQLVEGGEYVIVGPADTILPKLEV